MSFTILFLIISIALISLFKVSPKASQMAEANSEDVFDEYHEDVIEDSESKVKNEELIKDNQPSLINITSSIDERYKEFFGNNKATNILDSEKIVEDNIIDNQENDINTETKLDGKPLDFDIKKAVIYSEILKPKF